jgi:hypothetical protein
MTKAWSLLQPDALQCLRTQGSDAYSPEQYGPTLTITRKFSRTGASSYSLAPHGAKVPLPLAARMLHACAA